MLEQFTENSYEVPKPFHPAVYKNIKSNQKLDSLVAGSSSPRIAFNCILMISYSLFSFRWTEFVARKSSSRGKFNPLDPPINQYPIAANIGMLLVLVSLQTDL